MEEEIKPKIIKILTLKQKLSKLQKYRWKNSIACARKNYQSRKIKILKKFRFEIILKLATSPHVVEELVQSHY